MNKQRANCWAIHTIRSGKPERRPNPVGRVSRPDATTHWLGIAISLAVLSTACNAPQSDPNVAGPLRIERTASRELGPAERRHAFYKEYRSGLALSARNEYGLALGAFERALTHEPDSTAAMIAIGACHEMIGDPIQAVRYYRGALAIDPADPDAFANLGTAYIKLFYRENNAAWREMAMSSWRQSLALNPDQPDVRDFLTREIR